MIVELDLQGNVLQYLGRPDLTWIRLRERDGGAQERGKIQSPTDVAIRDGELYVLGKSRVQIFDLEGTFKAEFSFAETSFSEAMGLAVDAQHHVFVSDAVGGTIFAYDRTGQLLYSFGHAGSKHEEFSQPRGLWIDKDNRIYVADSRNGRVQVFQLHNDSSQAH
jgi:DNA-binding beta-propeller fold protein YncE